VKVCVLQVVPGMMVWHKPADAAGEFRTVLATTLERNILNPRTEVVSMRLACGPDPKGLTIRIPDAGKAAIEVKQ
jgi:hypothetical protein